MKKHFIYLGIIIAIILAFSVKSWLDIRKWEKVVQDYRRVIIDQDSLRLEENGTYRKLVDDMHTERSLKEFLKEENSNLFESVQEEKGKVKSLTRIIASFKETDIVNVLPPSSFSEDGKEIDFTSFYPNKLEPFITFTGNINTDTKKLLENWKFSDINIDLVVNETTTGFYEAIADVPDFMSISSIEVNSLPTEDPAKQGLGNFGFILGAGVSKQFSDDYSKMGVGLGVGVRYKRFTLLLEGDTNEMIGLKILKEF
jgi:hypothetical protein